MSCLVNGLIVGKPVCLEDSFGRIFELFKVRWIESSNRAIRLLALVFVVKTRPLNFLTSLIFPSVDLRNSLVRFTSPTSCVRDPYTLRSAKSSVPLKFKPFSSSHPSHHSTRSTWTLNSSTFSWFNFSDQSAAPKFPVHLFASRSWYRIALQIAPFFVELPPCVSNVFKPTR